MLRNANRGHKLMTKEIEARIPRLYATDGVPLAKKVVQVKFFTPMSNWTWFAFEYDPETREFFGFVEGFEGELGYFSLDELEAQGGNIERDCYMSPKPFAEVRPDLCR